MSIEEQLSKPFYHTDFRESLEKIVLKIKPEKEDGLVEKVFATKSKTLQSTIRALLDEIELREKLDIHLLDKINQDICWQRTQFEQIDKLQIHYVIDWFKDVSKVKMQFENNILALEKEKREEYLECWRDLMELKKYLLIALKDFWEFVKKIDLLEVNIENN